MSASRDKSQRIAFVYSNLYEIYRKGKEAAKAADTSRVFRAPVEGHPGLARAVDTARVLKAADAHAPDYARVRGHNPVNLISKRLEAAHVAAKVEAAARAREGHAEAASAGDTLRARIEAVRAERAEAPATGHPPAARASSSAVRDLKDNLKSLTDLHSRLRFMLLELEDLVKE